MKGAIKCIIPWGVTEKVYPEYSKGAKYVGRESGFVVYRCDIRKEFFIYVSPVSLLNHGGRPIPFTGENEFTEYGGTIFSIEEI